MRLKRLFLLTTLVLVTLGVLLCRHQRQSGLPPKSEEQVGQTGSSVSNAPVMVEKTIDTAKVIAAQPKNPSPAINDREKTNEIRRYMESQNKPINFYVKIVDQDDNPLSGVKVKGAVRHIKVVVPAAWGDEDQNIPIEKETDSGGRFEIHGITGANFSLESIQKDSYEPEPFVHTYGASGGNLQEPMILKMWSTNIHEKLIAGGRPFDVVPDGRLYFINLTDDTIAESGKGDLKVSILYTNQPERGHVYDWSCEIEVVSGGLLEEDNLNAAMFIAPPVGYVPAFQFHQQIRGGQRGSIGTRRFYVQLKNGAIFGRITIEMIAPFDDQTPGLIRLSYAINPSGSRVLR